MSCLFVRRCLFDLTCGLRGTEEIGVRLALSERRRYIACCHFVCSRRRTTQSRSNASTRGRGPAVLICFDQQRPGAPAPPQPFQIPTGFCFSQGSSCVSAWPAAAVAACACRSVFSPPVSNLRRPARACFHDHPLFADLRAPPPSCRTLRRL